jgi:hypothetical protein
VTFTRKVASEEKRPLPKFWESKTTSPCFNQHDDLLQPHLIQLGSATLCYHKRSHTTTKKNLAVTSKLETELRREGKLLTKTNGVNMMSGTLVNLNPFSAKRREFVDTFER